jgi:lactate racemase
MVVTICYGDMKLKLELPDTVDFDKYECPAGEETIGYGDFVSQLKQAEIDLYNISSADLFVINDAYRPTPTATILEWLHGGGKLSPEARFLISTGAHARPTETQLKKILGGLYDELKDRTLVHDARDSEALVEVGREADNQAVSINRHFLEAKRVVVIGSVEPHYFAGFSGGRKSIFPGLCDYETIVRNHNRAVSFKAAPLKLKGNPIEEHLESLMNFVPAGKIFSIQTVSGSNGRIRGIFCGILESSFQRAVECAHKIYGFKARHKYDLILAEVRPPLDSNLYQLQKSLENCQQAISDGGTVILFSPCRGGVGSESFYTLADRWRPGAIPDSRGEDLFGIHKLYRTNAIGERVNVFLYSELAPGVPDKVYFKSAAKPQEIVYNIASTKRSPKVALVRDAGHVVLTRE